MPFMKGARPWNKGLTISDPRVLSYAIKRRSRVVSAITRQKLSAARSKHQWYTNCQDCSIKKGFNRSPRCNTCAARYRVIHYPNSMAGKKLSIEHKEKILAASTHQTKPERQLQDLLNIIFSGFQPYLYTGSGNDKFFINLQNGRIKRPDFTNRRNKIIEVFGDYWHKGEDPNDLITLYKQVGWDCMVVWESELNSLWRLEKRHPNSIHLTSFRDDIVRITYPMIFQQEIDDFNRELQ